MMKVVPVICNPDANVCFNPCLMGKAGPRGLGWGFSLGQGSLAPSPGPWTHLLSRFSC